MENGSRQVSNNCHLSLTFDLVKSRVYGIRRTQRLDRSLVFAMVIEGEVPGDYVEEIKLLIEQ